MKMAGDLESRAGYGCLEEQSGAMLRVNTGLQKILGSKGVNTKTGMYRVVGGGCGRKQQQPSARWETDKMWGAMSPSSAWHLGHTHPVSQGSSGLSIRDSGT